MKTVDELREFFYSQLGEIEQLEVKRKKTANNVIKALAIIWSVVVFACILLLMNVNYVQFIFYFLIGGVALSFFSYQIIIQNYSVEFKDIIIKRIVEFIDDGLSYFKDGKVSPTIYNESALFRTNYERYNGDDYVNGRIGVTDIEFSELHTEYSVRTKNGRRWVTIFKGLFFVADFNKNFSGKTFVLPDGMEGMLGGLANLLQKANIGRGELVKLEDNEFEKEFVVYGDDQLEARYILSPSLMKRIVDFKKKTQKNIRLAFVNSRVFVAIHYNKNLFEPHVFNTLLDFEPIREYFEDLQTAIGIVEELNLNTRIWTKE